MIIESKILTYSQSEMDRASALGLSEKVERVESRIFIDLISGVSFFESQNCISMTLPNGVQYELPISYDEMRDWYNGCLSQQFPSETTTILKDGSRMITQNQHEVPPQVDDEGIVVDYGNVIEKVTVEHYKKSITQEQFKDALDAAIKQVLEQII